MTKLSIIFFALFSSLLSFGQLGLSERYQYNYLGINPAFAGENSAFGIKAVTDNQLLGLQLNKSSQILVLDGQLYKQTGLAFQGYRVSEGAIINSGFNLAYSKGFEINEFKCKLGVGTGIFIQPNILGLTLGNRTSFHGGAGLFSSYKSFYFGASVPVLIASKSYFEPKVSYSTIGYLRDIIEEEFKLNVNILAKNYNQKQFYDFNSRVILKDRLSLGFSFRQNLPELSPKATSFYPFAAYKFSKSMTIGLGYNPRSFQISSPQQAGSLGPTGSIQVYLKFLNVADDDQSWYGSLF